MAETDDDVGLAEDEDVVPSIGLVEVIVVRLDVRDGNKWLKRSLIAPKGQRIPEGQIAIGVFVQMSLQFKKLLSL